MINRFKAAWKVFVEEWRTYTPERPYRVVLKLYTQLSEKQVAGIQAIVDHKAHARTFPKKKEGSK